MTERSRRPTGAGMERRAFAETVNMTPAQLASWLESPEAGRVGSGSGRRVLELLRTPHEDLTAADLEQMRKVVGHVRRVRAQGPPEGDAEHSAWRYSLMDWGHDPLR